MAPGTSWTPPSLASPPWPWYKNKAIAKPRPSERGGINTPNLFPSCLPVCGQSLLLAEQVGEQKEAQVMPTPGTSLPHRSRWKGRGRYGQQLVCQGGLGPRPYCSLGLKSSSARPGQTGSSAVSRSHLTCGLLMEAFPGHPSRAFHTPSSSLWHKSSFFQSSSEVTYLFLQGTA